MLGAIMGDICGSPWEGGTCREETFELFPASGTITDDTVCTVAVADALLNQRPVAESLREWCRRYPGMGYGGLFNRWVYRPSTGPYQSWGNGGAMRVSPCAWLAKSLAEAEFLAFQTASVTHDHPEGLRGARAIAGAIWLARQGLDQTALMRAVTARYHYELGMHVLERAELNPSGSDALDTVPIALDCGMQATSVADAIHRAVYIGGDSDTTASMSAAIAEARFGLDADQVEMTLARVPADMRLVVEALYARVGQPMARPAMAPAASRDKPEVEKRFQFLHWLARLVR
ncbi:ADP-ribosylglycohydrolase family protein [Paraburkholderia aspalathi]|nr:ADP-ribosylglycohydrolase family protein [Paraburkholderia aspalathi]MBK3780024.1 ADP-ribosylglycohydrolase family protein [Paraburkholderia aspalathi]